LEVTNIGIELNWIGQKRLFFLKVIFWMGMEAAGNGSLTDSFATDRPVDGQWTEKRIELN
jgi:hypothetical protein